MTQPNAAERARLLKTVADAICDGMGRDLSADEITEGLLDILGSPDPLVIGAEQRIEPYSREDFEAQLTSSVEPSRRDERS